MSFRNRIGAAVLGLALAAPTMTLAQSDAADQTGTGGGPDSTITAPYTTSTGETKPPGVQEGPETQSERRELDWLKRQDDQIEKGICSGC